GRPLVPYPGALRAALTRLQPVLLDACWKSPDPDEALNQFERFLAAAGPRAGYVELLAARPELLAGLVRLCAGGDLLAQLLGAQVERYGVPRDARGRFIPAVVVGLGKLGGRELTTGSDLDIFVTFGRADADTTDGETDGGERVDAHTFYSGAVERLASALGD